MVEGEGFEPSKAEPSDLQSDPFGRSGIPPSVHDKSWLPAKSVANSSASVPVEQLLCDVFS